MKKLNLFALAAIVMLTLGVSKNVNAQISVGLTGGVGIPMGDFGDIAGMGFGGGLQGRYAINDNLHVGAGLGYYMFSGTEIDLGFFKMTSNYKIMPITVSGDYYFMTDGFKPFATIDLGMFSVGGTVENTAMVVGGVTMLPAATTDMTGETKFGFGIGAGAAYGLNDNLDFIGSLKYNSVSVGTPATALSWIGINVGVSMKFGN